MTTCCKGLVQTWQEVLVQSVGPWKPQEFRTRAPPFRGSTARSVYDPEDPLQTQTGVPMASPPHVARFPGMVLSPRNLYPRMCSFRPTPTPQEPPLLPRPDTQPRPQPRSEPWTDPGGRCSSSRQRREQVTGTWLAKVPSGDEGHSVCVWGPAWTWEPAVTAGGLRATQWGGHIYVRVDLGIWAAPEPDPGRGRPLAFKALPGAGAEGDPGRAWLGRRRERVFGPQRCGHTGAARREGLGCTVGGGG